VSTDCLGDFDLEVAQRSFENYRLYAPDLVEAAARAAAKEAGRKLLAPMTRGPWEAMPGDRSYVWRLSGEPGMVVKVRATDRQETVRMWNRSISVLQALRPPSDLCTPRVHFAGNQPVPWCVIDAAVGTPTFLTGMGAAEAFEVVQAVQRTQLDGLRFGGGWDASTYARQVREPVAELVGAQVITEGTGRRVLQTVAEHRHGVRECPPVLAHNDLALYHVFAGGPTKWLLDWESVVYERLRMLDVAQLIVSHGVTRPEWACELARIALEHAWEESGADLTSNLVVAMLERAAGKALDHLRRRHQQSTQAVDALCAVLDGRFLPRTG